MVVLRRSVCIVDVVMFEMSFSLLTMEAARGQNCNWQLQG
jgi:hypothetical protein